MKQGSLESSQSPIEFEKQRRPSIDQTGVFQNKDQYNQPYIPIEHPTAKESNHTQLIPPPAEPSKQYWELPAGLMVPLVNINSSPYTPIKASMIKETQSNSKFKPELSRALEDFYSGIKKQREGIESKNQHISTENDDDDVVVVKREHKKLAEGEIDLNGWQVGYLDFWYKKISSARNKSRLKSRVQTHGLPHDPQVRPQIAQDQEAEVEAQAEA
ncbi:hypothetical protein HK096_011085 [Nowakowskiella sp. JEL0078]|nr:hypothetical protein HK096_011085 [Nowakowskiella sp. JEL0078]